MLYLSGLAVFVVTALFSSGYHNHDEHFQLLEFAGYKAGLSPATDLPWEFGAGIRPALQPFIVYLLIKSAQAISCYNPFVIATLLRVAMAVLNWYAIVKIISVALPDVTSLKDRKWLVASCLLLWFVPYISVRYSAEGFAGMMFCFAAYHLIVLGKTGDKRYSHLIIAGLLLGFGWFARVQLSFALIGVAIWILFVQKWTPRYWLLMILSFALVVGICVVIDHWFYNEWLFTPYRYFETNILHNKASEFGVSPWWSYFELFLMNGVPPISIVLLVLFFRGLWKQPLHLFSLVCITFFLGHFMIGHKEMRFLFPMAIPFLFTVFTGYSALQDIPLRRIYTIGLRVLLFINGGLLIYRAFMPAQDMTGFYRFMYRETRRNMKGTTKLYYTGTSPYEIITLNVNYYKPSRLELRSIDSLQQLPAGYYATYFYSSKLLDKQTTEKFHLQREYTSLPDWLLKYNINNWQERTKIGVIYRVRR